MSELHKKLQEIQSELNAPKSQYNAFGKYKYRKAEDILEAVKPLLKKTGTTLLISDDIVFIEGRFYVKATATIMDGEDMLFVSAFARESDNKTGMDAAQVTGAASSYARKYALNGLFCIDDNQDTDATNTHDEKRTENKSELDTAIAKIMAAKTDDEVKEIWYASGSLKTNEAFKKAIAEKRRAIKAKQ